MDLGPLPIAATSETAGVLTDLFLVLVAAKLGDEVFKRIGQPAIVGEILGGEVGIVVASIGAAAGVVDAELFGVVVGMSILTALAAPFVRRRLSRPGA